MKPMYNEKGQICGVAILILGGLIGAILAAAYWGICSWIGGLIAVAFAIPGGLVILYFSGALGVK
jgi:hypothetical protein